jgi:hypothetical protein
MSEQTLAEIERIVTEGGDADDLLREVVAALVADPAIEWAGIGFLEGSDLTLGPSAGAPNDERRTRVPVVFEGAPVGELWVDGDPDPALLDRVTTLVAPQVLIGWDTAGEPWIP